MPRKRSHRDPDRHTERASIACDHCRDKKVRCDGNKPHCTRCEQKNLNCTFSRVDKRRSSVSVEEGGQSMVISTPQSSIQTLPRPVSEISNLSRYGYGNDSHILRPLRPSYRTATSASTPLRHPGSPKNESSTRSQIDSRTQGEYMSALFMAGLEAEDSTISSPGGTFNWPSETLPLDLRKEASNQAGILHEPLDSAILRMYNFNEGNTRHSSSQFPLSLPEAGSSSEVRQDISSTGVMGPHQGSPHQGSSQMVGSSGDLMSTVMLHPHTLNIMLGSFWQHCRDQFSFLNQEVIVHRVNDRSIFQLIAAICGLASITASTNLTSDINLTRDAKIARKHAEDCLQTFSVRSQKEPTFDSAATSLLYSIYQLSDGDPSRSLSLLDHSSSAVQSLVTQNTSKSEVDIAHAILYWNIYCFYHMFSFVRKEKPRWHTAINVSIPNISVQQGQQASFFPFFVKMMKIVSSFTEYWYSEGQLGADISELKKIRKDTHDWYADFSQALRTSSSFTALHQEPCIYLQAHFWFYALTLLIQQALLDRRRADENPEHALDLTQQWATQKMADLIIHYKAIKPQHLLSCPLICIPIHIAQRQSHFTSTRLSSSVTADGGDFRMVSDQTEQNLALFIETIGEIENLWPATRVLLQSLWL